MSTQKEIEHRRRKVQKFLSMNYTADEIAGKLNVHPQTVYNDKQALESRYKKMVAENPHYLKRQHEKILKFIDDLDILINEYYELMERAKTTFKYTDKDGKEKEVELADINSLRQLLDSIRSTKMEQAKILKLVGGDNKFLQQNYIHIEKLNNTIEPLLTMVKLLVTKFVPEDKREEAFVFVKNFMQNQKVIDGEVINE